MMTRSHFQKVDLRHSADQVLLRLQRSLENLGFQIVELDTGDRKIVADLTGSHGWFASLVEGVVLDRVDFPVRVRIEARAESTGEGTSTLFIETRQLFSLLASFGRRPRMTTRILYGLTEGLHRDPAHEERVQ